jgi:hypothetical protein
MCCVADRRRGWQLRSDMPEGRTTEMHAVPPHPGPNAAAREVIADYAAVIGDCQFLAQNK